MATRRDRTPRTSSSSKGRTDREVRAARRPRSITVELVGHGDYLRARARAPRSCRRNVHGRRANLRGNQCAGGNFCTVSAAAMVAIARNKPLRTTTSIGLRRAARERLRGGGKIGIGRTLDAVPARGGISGIRARGPNAARYVGQDVGHAPGPELFLPARPPRKPPGRCSRSSRRAPRSCGCSRPSPWSSAPRLRRRRPPPQIVLRSAIFLIRKAGAARPRPGPPVARRLVGARRGDGLGGRVHTASTRARRRGRLDALGPLQVHPIITLREGASLHLER